MKLGYSTWGMPTVPIDTALHHLARLGYQGVEITVIPGWITELSSLNSAERKRIVKLAKQVNLALPAIAAHTNLLARDPKEHAQNLQRLKGAVDLAVDWAIDGHLPCIDTTAGGAPDEYATVKALLVERLNELVDYAKTRGVVIALEPHVGAAINTPQRVLEVLHLVNSPYLKLNFDISHFNVVGYSIEESVAACGPHSAHTHIKDERGIFPDHEFLIPGEGVFDYVKYLKEMQKVGYQGFISPEISIMVQRRPNYDPLAAATQTYQVLAQAFETAGIDRNQ